MCQKFVSISVIIFDDNDKFRYSFEFSALHSFLKCVRPAQIRRNSVGEMQFLRRPWMDYGGSLHIHSSIHAEQCMCYCVQTTSHVKFTHICIDF